MVHWEMFTYCPKDPHCVLGRCLVYLIILINHMTWYLALILGCLVRFCELDEIYFNRLGSSLKVHFLNKLINTLKNWLTTFKQIFSNMPNIFLIWVFYRNLLIPLSHFSILCPIFLNIGHWNA